MAHEPRVVPGLALVFAAVFLARCPPAVQAQSCESSVGGGCFWDDCCAGMYCDGWSDWCAHSSTPLLTAAPLICCYAQPSVPRWEEVKSRGEFVHIVLSRQSKHLIAELELHHVFSGPGTQ